MTGWVVDASVFGSIVLADELEAPFPGLVEQLAEGTCQVPQHWHLEVTNHVLMGLRRKRIASGRALESIALIERLPVLVDSETSNRSTGIYQLAFTHALTTYDAAYLELAIRGNLALATFDKALRRAAKKESVALAN